MLNGSLLKVAQAKLLGSEHDYKTKFDPRHFLDTYYGQQLEPTSSASSSSCFELDLLQFQLESLHYIYQRISEDKENNNRLIISKPMGKPSRLLDVGSGPSLTVALGASAIFDQIFLSDLSEKCRQELVRFLEYDGKAFDWNHVARFIGDLENTDDEVVMERAREKVLNKYQLFSEISLHFKQLLLEKLSWKYVKFFQIFR